jgi:hypothetical protein
MNTQTFTPRPRTAIRREPTPCRCGCGEKIEKLVCAATWRQVATEHKTALKSEVVEVRRAAVHAIFKVADAVKAGRVDSRRPPEPPPNVDYPPR